MDYIKIHHLWQPLAAISTREEINSASDETTSTTTTHNSITMIFNSSTNRIINMTTILSAITRATTTTSSIDYDNITFEHKAEHYYKDYFNNATITNNNINNIFNDSSIDIFNGNNGDLYNYTLDPYYNNNYTNVSNDDMDQTWQLITMIGTAVALGLLILATVIGKLIKKKKILPCIVNNDCNA